MTPAIEGETDVITAPVSRMEGLVSRLFGDVLANRDPFNIGSLVDLRAREAPNAPAVLSGNRGDQVLTYGGLAERSNRLASALVSMGLQRGDRVAVSLPQGPDCAITHAAVLKAGCISTPLSRMYGESAAATRLHLAEPRIVVCDSSNADLYYHVCAQINIDAAIVVSGKSSPGMHSLNDLIGRGYPSWRAEQTDRDEPALLLFTSGTTGPPKGVLHGHRVVPGHAASLSLAHNLFPRLGSILWTPADWSWAGGLVNCLLYSWYAGVPIVAAPDRPFDAHQSLQLLGDTGVTSAFIPPTALKRMRASFPGSVRHLTRLTSVMSGSESLGADLIDWTTECLGVVPNEVYGQTEASAIVGNCSALIPVRPGSMGMPYPGGDVAVIDADGNVVPPGDLGEFAVSASTQSIFLGYWRDVASTEAKFLGATKQWMRLGDTGTRDEDGYLWFRARSDDVINSAGYRIGPSEIEQCLRRHPAVLDAAVVGLPDPQRGSVVAAYLELRDGYSGSPELQQSLADLVATELAPFQRPRRIEVVEALPRTVTGKVRRAALREQFQ